MSQRRFKMAMSRYACAAVAQNIWIFMLSSADRSKSLNMHDSNKQSGECKQPHVLNCHITSTRDGDFEGNIGCRLRNPTISSKKRTKRSTKPCLEGEKHPGDTPNRIWEKWMFWYPPSRQKEGTINIFYRLVVSILPMDIDCISDYFTVVYIGFFLKGEKILGGGGHILGGTFKFRGTHNFFLEMLWHNI